jgi:hypothetical protein
VGAGCNLLQYKLPVWSSGRNLTSELYLLAVLSHDLGLHINIHSVVEGGAGENITILRNFKPVGYREFLRPTTCSADAGGTAKFWSRAEAIEGPLVLVDFL